MDSKVDHIFFSRSRFGLQGLIVQKIFRPKRPAVFCLKCGSQRIGGLEAPGCSLTFDPTGFPDWMDYPVTSTLEPYRQGFTLPPTHSPGQRPLPPATSNFEIRLLNHLRHNDVSIIFFQHLGYGFFIYFRNQIGTKDQPKLIKSDIKTPSHLHFIVYRCSTEFL